MGTERPTQCEDHLQTSAVQVLVLQLLQLRMQWMHELAELRIKLETASGESLAHAEGVEAGLMACQEKLEALLRASAKALDMPYIVEHLEEQNIWLLLQCTDTPKCA